MTNEQYLELYNLLFDANIDIKDYEGMEEEIKDDILPELVDELIKYGYDGDYTYQSMYWFIKGLKVSKPSITPKEAPKINENKPFNPSDVTLKPTQTKTLKFHFRPDINDKQLKNVFLRPLNPKVSQSFKDDLNFVHKAFKAMKNKNISYDEYKRIKYGDLQTDLINEITNSLYTNPTNWNIDFSNMSVKTREAIFDMLNNYLSTTLGEMATTYKFEFAFKVNGSWRSKPLTPELYRKLRENFTQKTFIYNAMERDYSYTPNNFSNPEEWDVIDWTLFDAIGVKLINERKGEKQKKGGYFRYINKTDLDLRRYQIFDKLYKMNKKGKKKQRKELNDYCFVYALRQDGFNNDDLNKLRARFCCRYQSPKNINLVCQEFKIHLIIHDLEYKSNHSLIRNQGKKNPGQKGTYLGVPKEEAKYIVEMNLFKDHFFLEEPTPYTRDYIVHKYVNKEVVPEQCYNKRFNKNCWYVTKEENRFMKSGALIKLLFDSDNFRPTTYNEESILNTVNLNKVNADDIQNLEYDEQACIQKIEPKKKIKKYDLKMVKTYWYADFEADTSKEIHVPYMCCLHSKDGFMKKEFRGVDCAEDLLNFLPNGAVVYFHNLGYDFRFLAKFGVKNTIIKGTKTMKGKLAYNDKILEFRDTLPILSCKLSALPEMFDIKGIKKELFPYNYYTIDRLNENNGIALIEGAGDNEKSPWSDEDYKTFNENIDAIPKCRIDDKHFNMWLYCSFYCHQDVNILRLGFNKFCASFNKEFGLNPFDFISAASLANEVFNKLVYYPNGNLYKVGGHVRLFMQKAIRGGRCMCAFNKRWNVKGKISDYDAVSLYASAMARLWTVEGKPEVLKHNGKGYKSIPDYLKKYNSSNTGTGAYIIEISITHVGKHLALPMIVKETKEGNLNEGTKSPTISWSDTGIDEEHPLKMIVDNITLEDLIEFQKITFNVIRGYVWNGKRDYRIRYAIKKIFNKRLEYKAQHNSLEQLYKLIMNSCYGKTIEKPVMKDWKYIKDETIYNKKLKKETNKLNDFLNNHYNTIDEHIQLEGSNIHAFHCFAPIDKHFNFSLLGIQVLSMSKRITNEVSCLAYDLGCQIYYTDTDSFHLRYDDIPIIEEAYKKKYNRELRGKQMGQFHSDFPEIKDHKETPYSIHSIFIGKKLYIDELTDSTGEISYMVRGKGLTQKSIKAQADKYGGFIPLYEALYNGSSVTFDLADGQPSFTLNKNMTISTNDHFYRQAKTTYKEGNINEYFPKI